EPAAKRDHADRRQRERDGHHRARDGAIHESESGAADGSPAGGDDHGRRAAEGAVWRAARGAPEERLARKAAYGERQRRRYAHVYRRVTARPVAERSDSGVV